MPLTEIEEEATLSTSLLPLLCSLAVVNLHPECHRTAAVPLYVWRENSLQIRNSRCRVSQHISPICRVDVRPFSTLAGDSPPSVPACDACLLPRWGARASDSCTPTYRLRQWGIGWDNAEAFVPYATGTTWCPWDRAEWDLWLESSRGRETYGGISPNFQLDTGKNGWQREVAIVGAFISWQSSQTGRRVYCFYSNTCGKTWLELRWYIIAVRYGYWMLLYGW